MIKLAGRRVVMTLVGVTVAASISFGGWKLLERAETTPTQVPVSQPLPKLESRDVAVASAKSTDSRQAPKPGSVSAAKPTPVVELDAPVKERPTGSKHSKQDELLTAMASRLHSDALNKFISQPGMGMSRMMPTLRIVPREWKIPEWTSEEITKQQPPQVGMKDLSLIHRLSLNQFSASNGPKDPRPAKELPPERIEQLWEIHSLDLVGLVMHETPKAYVSKKLPEMKDLKTTPIRDLDLFESEGLEELMNGKELYVRSNVGTIRVLGPIRASKACLKCHGDAKDGDMLGAFSYTLREARYEHGFRNGTYQPFPANGLKGSQIPSSSVQP